MDLLDSKVLSYKKRHYKLVTATPVSRMTSHKETPDDRLPKISGDVKVVYSSLLPNDTDLRELPSRSGWAPNVS